MKIKKFLTTSLSATALLLGLAACNGGGGSSAAVSSAGTSSAATSSAASIASSAASATSTNPLAGKYTITVWVSEADGVTDLTEDQIEAFEQANPGIDIDATIEGVSESNAAGQMLLDIDAGADIYCFAQDQFARLVQGQALSQLGQGAASYVVTNNSASSANAVKSGDAYYAYPLTADNGYFMYYDKSVIQESSLGDLDKIIADVKAANKKISWNLGTDGGWYIAGWFFGNGCVSNWTTDADGNFTSVYDTFNSAEGLVAAKAMKAFFDSGVYNHSASAADFDAAIPSAAVVSGTWDYKTAKDILGNNLGAVELPKVKVGDHSYHLGSFSGMKLMGVKPQTDAKRNAVLHQLAQYLTGETCSVQRATEFGWGPSNLAAQKSSVVTSNPALSALAAQSAYAVPQGQISGGWWDLAVALGTSIQAATDEAGLKAALETYEAATKELATPFVLEKVSLIGTIGGENWNNDHDLVKQNDGSYVLDSIALTAGEQFKARANHKWEKSLGFDNLTTNENFESGDGNIKVVKSGTYRVVVDKDFTKITISELQ